MKRAVLAWGGVSLALCAAWPLGAEEQTRGVGVYPGRPSEDWAPVLVPETTTYRNLALRRAALQSSSYDYNLTAQLLTDGIVQETLPRWMATSTARRGVLPKHERELLVDDNAVSTVSLEPEDDWVQLELGGGDAPLVIDGIDVLARVASPGGWGTPPPTITAGSTWTCVVQGSSDGETWSELGRLTQPFELEAQDESIPVFFRRGPEVSGSIPLSGAEGARFYRLSLESSAKTPWAVAEVTFRHGADEVEVGGPYRFESAWMPEGAVDEWVSVDLGASATFDRVVLRWIRPAAAGSIQVSEDGESWTDVQALPEAPSTLSEIRLAKPAQGRYVRVLLKRPSSPDGYVLSELEVYGRGGVVARPAVAPTLAEDGSLRLAGGAWRLQRGPQVQANGAAISQVGFDDEDWVVATVPATVLSSYWNVGAIPDPNFGANQLAISDSFFHADFWYRTELQVPPLEPGRRAWLELDGVNWKAEVYLNGAALGRVEGAFMRGLFDVTAHVRPGEANALAVRIEKNATPGSVKQKTLETAGLNGGALGADNPTYHASIGWDWIPTVRGRNIGLWNDVALTTSGPVTMVDPFVRSTLPLPDTTRADLHVVVELRNHAETPVSGVLKGRFGDVAFEQSVTLDAGASREVVLDPSTHPALRLRDPKLWWPAGYGEPHLYDVALTFEIDGAASDTARFKSGVRQLTYSEDDDTLRIWINGRRFVGRGGNWGFPESNLRYRAREYDVAVRYHRDMSFTMIRNWVGQTGDDELYEACDRHGIVVWQDFWLANPVDGPNPDDEDLFLSNVRDTVRRIRNHASVGLYCGRNEGDPPKTIDDRIRAAIPELHPDLHYVSHSSQGVVSGGGPYAAQSPKFYFLQRATPKLHSELGMPNIVTMDSLRQMLPESALWPPALEWGLHDFNLQSAQRLSSFQRIVDHSYGGADNVEDWLELAQFVNYEGYRAIFEAQSRTRMGMLLWMSHPAWPSFVWQTYDYYFEPTAAYFGCKKGSEPLHIQWNPAVNTVEIVNYHAGDVEGLTARAEILHMDGRVAWTQEATVDSREDSYVDPIELELPEGLTPVYFIRLALLKDGKVLSENFYWDGTKYRDFTALRTLPAVTVETDTQVEREGDRFVLTTELRNPTTHPALMVRVKPVRAQSGDRILPALISDNYVALMPGESKTIRTTIDVGDARGEEPRIVVEGFNVR